METNDLLILAQWLATVARCPCGMDCIKLGRIDCPACPYRPQVQKGMGGIDSFRIVQHAPQGPAPQGGGAAQGAEMPRQKSDA